MENLSNEQVGIISIKVLILCFAFALFFLEGCSQSRINLHGKDLGYSNKLLNKENQEYISIYQIDKNIYFSLINRQKYRVLPVHKYQKSLVTQKYRISRDIWELFSPLNFFLLTFLGDEEDSLERGSMFPDHEKMRDLNFDYHEDLSQFKFTIPQYPKKNTLLGGLHLLFSTLPGINHYYPEKYFGVINEFDTWVSTIGHDNAKRLRSKKQTEIDEYIQQSLLPEYYDEPVLYPVLFEVERCTLRQDVRYEVLLDEELISYEKISGNWYCINLEKEKNIKNKTIKITAWLNESQICNQKTMVR